MKKMISELKTGDVIVVIASPYLSKSHESKGAIGVVDTSTVPMVTLYMTDSKKLDPTVNIPLSDIDRQQYICPLLGHPNLLNEVEKTQELIKQVVAMSWSDRIGIYYAKN